MYTLYVDMYMYIYIYTIQYIYIMYYIYICICIHSIIQLLLLIHFWVALLVRRYLSSAASFVLCAVRRVKGAP